MSGGRGLLLDLVTLGAGAVFARVAYYELFVTVPRVHAARWPGPWTTPKLAATAMLLAAALGVVAALLLVVVVRAPELQRALRRVELVALAVSVGAWLTWNLDFLGKAGRFG